nr:S26 family signal peptidase [Glycomyces sp. L485]
MLVNVDGESMEPALRDGDEVLAKRTRRIEVGQIVVVAAPDPLLGWAEPPKKGRGPWWVKRVAAVAGEPMPGSDETVPPGHYFLLSDNPVGEDSRRHGVCPARMIAGVMVRKF